jgi:hypothetical protein
MTRKRLRWTAAAGATLVAAGAFAFDLAAMKDDGPGKKTPSVQNRSTPPGQAYWTKERRRKAKPEVNAIPRRSPHK